MGPDHEKMVEIVRGALPRDAVVVKDATISSYVWANRTLPVYEPRTSMRPVSMAIGPGLPLAIGACIGSGRRTLVVHGDGGLMLSVGELATAVQQELPLITCVFNDRGYGILRFIQDLTLGGRRSAVDLVTPDFAGARSVGRDGGRERDDRRRVRHRTRSRRRARWPDADRRRHHPDGGDDDPPAAPVGPTALSAANRGSASSTASICNARRTRDTHE